MAVNTVDHVSRGCGFCDCVKDYVSYHWTMGVFSSTTQKVDSFIRAMSSPHFRAGTFEYLPVDLSLRVRNRITSMKDSPLKLKLATIFQENIGTIEELKPKSLLSSEDGPYYREQYDLFNELRSEGKTNEAAQVMKGLAASFPSFSYTLLTTAAVDFKAALDYGHAAECYVDAALVLEKSLKNLGTQEYESLAKLSVSAAKNFHDGRMIKECIECYMKAYEYFSKAGILHEAESQLSKVKDSYDEEMKSFQGSDLVNAIEFHKTVIEFLKPIQNLPIVSYYLAQGAEKYNKEAQIHMKQGSYLLAASFFEQAANEYSKISSLKIDDESLQSALSAAIIPSIDNAAIKEGNFWHLAGEAYKQAAEFDKAASSYKNASFAFSKDRNAGLHAAEALLHIAYIYDIVKNTQVAIESYLQAASLYERQNAIFQAAGCVSHAADGYRQIENYKQSALVFLQAAGLYFRENNFEQAALMFKDASSMFEKAGRVDSAVKAVDDFSQTKLKYLPNSSKARIEHYEEVVTLYENLSSFEKEAHSLKALAKLYGEERQVNKASQCIEKAKELFQKSSLFDEASLVMLSKCDYVEDKKTNIQGMKADAYKESSLMFESHGEFKKAATHSLLAAHLYRGAARFQDGVLSYKKAAELFQKTHDATQFAESSLQAGNLYKQLNQYKEAVDLYTQAQACYQEQGMMEKVASMNRFIEEAKKNM